MLARELRNPLAPISTAAQMPKIGGTDEKRVRHASDVIDRQVRHMTKLVDDLLDVSRITRELARAAGFQHHFLTIISSSPWTSGNSTKYWNKSPWARVIKTSGSSK